MVWLLDGEKISKICLFVSTDHKRDRQTEGHCAMTQGALMHSTAWQKMSQLWQAEVSTNMD